MSMFINTGKTYLLSYSLTRSLTYLQTSIILVFEPYNSYIIPRGTSSTGAINSV